MDDELREYLDAMKAELKADLRASLERNVAAAAVSFGELHMQIQTSEKRLGERLDRIESRLDRQAGLIQTGSRWVARQGVWAERTDVSQDMQKEIHEIQERLRRVEGPAQ